MTNRIVNSSQRPAARASVLLGIAAVIALLTAQEVATTRGTWPWSRDMHVRLLVLGALGAWLSGQRMSARTAGIALIAAILALIFAVAGAR